VSRARIILLDPREALNDLRESLSTSHPSDLSEYTFEVLKQGELLKETIQGLKVDPPTLAILVDGDPESGLSPSLIRSSATEDPVLWIAVVGDPRQGRYWMGMGAHSFFQRPVNPEELRIHLKSWLPLVDQARRSLLREEALRRFFAMYAHDLKNPLGAISGYCELALEHPQLPPETRQDLKKVCRNIELLNAMAFGLLDMVRGTDTLQITMQDVHMSDVVRQAVEMLKLRAESRGIEIRVDCREPFRAIRIDPSRMIEALANVIDNAIRFSPLNSTIQVTVSEEPGGLAVTIDDNGPGIPADERERIFEKFTQGASHNLKGELGLGLYIARDIVERHRGTIRAEGLDSRGTRIAIRLPVQEEQEPGASREGSPLQAVVVKPESDSLSQSGRLAEEAE